MIGRMMTLGRTSFETPCRVEVELSDEYCRANVVLANDYEIGPGDRVRVHGAPISVGFGERRVLDRIATVERASTVERLWTKFAGHFEMTELYEVSFSDRTTV
jgi:hypothetical protein